jgi:DNA-binding MarR family transcriptional regulator
MLLDNQLCFALYRASRVLTRAYGPILEPLGLTYPQYLVMLVLWESDNVSVKQLGERLALDSATLTPLLKRLEQQELLSRARDADDERVLRLRLTAQGRALRAKAQRVPSKVVCALGYDPERASAFAEIAELRRQLNQLTVRLSVAQADSSAP